MLKVFFLIFTLQPFIIKAQDNFNYSHYGEKDGLPSATVYDMCQTKDGFMWFATENGLSRFDGLTFTNFTVKDGLPDNTVLKIFSDSKDRLWIGTFNKSICYFYKNKFYTKETDSLLAKIKLKGSINSIIEWGNMLYINDYSQILKIDGNSVSDFVSELKILVKPNSIIESFNSFDENLMKIRVDDSVMTIKKDKIEKIEKRVVFKNKNEHIFKINNKYYIASINGVNQYYLEKNKKLYKFKFHNKNISVVFEDAEKNIWFSSLGDGVFKLASESIFTIYNKYDSKKGEVFSLSPNKKSLICGLGYSKMLLVENNATKKITNFDNKLQFSQNPNISNRLYCSKSLNNGIVILGFDAFLAKFENGKYTYNYIFPIKSIEQIDLKNIIVGTGGYAFKIRLSDLKIIDTIWRERTTKVFYYNNYFYIGTLNGLYKVAEDKTFEYLGSLHHLLTRRIVDIKVTDRGVMWVATSDKGLVAFKENKILTTFTDSNNLSSNICKTLFLKNNYLWVGTAKGINKIDIADATYPIVKYGSSDGLPSDIINTIYVDDSSVYVGSRAGLTYFKEEDIYNSSICTLNLLSVKYGDSTSSLENSIQLSYKNNNVNFYYTGVSIRSGGNIVYNYKMIGLDKIWHSTVEKNLNYQGLASGDYQLQIYAVNRFGVQSNTLILNITISTPYYKKWWFYLFIITVLLSFTWWLAVRKSNNKRKKEKEKNELQQQFAQLEQQALQSQMNPHFIFNCLNSIQQYILTNEKEKANECLTGFASLMRQTLELSDKKTITVSEEISYLTKYLTMEKMRFGDNFKFEITQEKNIEPDFLSLPALLLQPYLENSLRHGIRYKEDGLGVVKIHFAKLDNRLLCIITDNGIGRAKAASYKGQQAIQYQSKGMNLTAKRIELLNKMNKSNITIKIIDLLNDAGNGIGTQVILNLKI